MSYLKVSIMSFILGMCCSVPAAAYTQDEVDIWSYTDSGKDVIIETKVFGCITKFTIPRKNVDQHGVLDSMAKLSVEHAANGCK